MVWECKEQIMCECGGLSTLSSPKEQFHQVFHTDNADLHHDKHSEEREEKKLIRSPEALKSLVLLQKVIKGPNGEQSDNTHRQSDRSKVSAKWHGIVEQYSFLQLTKETDQLPALSGLAKRAAPRLGNYLAGLWSSTLVSDLMWRVDKLDFGFGRPAEYIGPSWSWVSVSGPVSYWQDLENESNFYVADSWSITPSLKRKSQSISLSCDVQAAGKNPFGEIASAAVDITGYVQKARLKYATTRSEVGLHSTNDLVLLPLKYELEIPRTEEEPEIELSFYADYILSEGPHRIPQNALIHLLLVHPYVCLVLKVDESSQLSTGYLKVQRIGIVKQPRVLPDAYYLNWMMKTTPIRVRVV